MGSFLGEVPCKIRSLWEVRSQVERKQKKQNETYKLHFAFSIFSLLSLRCGTLFERLRCLLER